MELLVGLGNPGRRYEQTRHNIGFEVVRFLARRHAASGTRLKFESELAEIQVGEHRVLLACPQTYMNLSGRAVRQIVDFYKLPVESLLVVSDDLNLPTGQLRLRGSGSAGGQKGLQNIIDQLGTQQFARLRIGIDRPSGGGSATDYVLQRFSKSEQEVMERAVVRAADGVERWLQQGLAAAMNFVNADPDK